MLTQSELKTMLDYDCETGLFTWINPFHKKRQSLIAGSILNNGYWAIAIGNKKYLAHRLAWLYVYGCVPNGNIDHINNNKVDNRIINLRECNASENGLNAKIRTHNTTGYKGVTFHKSTGKFRARVGINGKRIHLGLFDSAIDAYQAYCSGVKKHNSQFFHAG